MNKLFYETFKQKIDEIKKTNAKPLTLTKKILSVHALSSLKESYTNFSPDRIAMQDATAQMAVLQFILAQKEKTAVPASIHCDHLILCKKNAKEDLKNALKNNKEVYEFLESAAAKYGIDFWKPGAGIIHQIILENYAFPGGMMIGTDSHTPNAGGLGMIAIGVGGADAVDVMVGLPWELKMPKSIGVKLTGKLQGWSSAKDVILKLAGILTVKGGTGAVIEYFGKGSETISCTGKATICNMGAEAGATCSIFPFDNKMAEFLNATNRIEIAENAKAIEPYLKADSEVYENPENYYDKVIEIDLSTLEPHINGPFTPDRAFPISKMKEAVKEHNFPKKVSAGLIGSCTNSSYEDLDRVASILKDAHTKNIKPKAPMFLTPGSMQIENTITRGGQIKIFQSEKVKVFPNCCGPCIGMWDRARKKDKPNTILTSFNRNFAKRNDGNPFTNAFVVSPEIATALSIAGKLTFNPLTDTIKNEKGEKVQLDPPHGDELPKNGFITDPEGVIKPPKEGSKVKVKIKKESERLQELEPFKPNKEDDFKNMRILMKAKGKCTTDHISMAGPWLKYRGHLDNISNNVLLDATNAFTGEVGKTTNVLTNEEKSPAEIAREYKKEEVGWVIIGDENYGEGSSREHAAMEPRFLGGKVVLVKSFARIHETNLKKQGMVALTFANPNDYDKIQADDRLTIPDINNFSRNTPLTVIIEHKDNTQEEIQTNHTYNETQIEWFWKGSCLNVIRNKK
ncbi:aconitate hydratase [Candidatus Margulisiibacteriota bacterium]